MKSRIRAVSILLMLGSVTGYAQDTTRRSTAGLRFGVEVGLQRNNSLINMGQTLQQTNIDAREVGNTFGNFVFLFVRDNRNYTGETRLLGMTTVNQGPLVNSAIRRAQLYGFGLGASGIYKMVNTRRFIVGPMLGYDFVWYRLALLPVDRTNVLLANIANNPAAYNPVTFRQRSLNLHAAGAVDYRMYWFQKYYNEFRFGAHVGYQLPILREGQWRFNDGTVSDLPGFQAKTLYYQFGISMFPKEPSRIR